MRHNDILLLSIIPAIFAVSCEPLAETGFTDRPVVSCYLSPDEIPTLNVKKIIPFESDVTFSSEDIEKLDITITDVTAGKDYHLESLGGGAYCDSSLVAEVGHTYSLYFVYDNVPVSAETVIPSVPTGVAFSSTSIEVMGFGTKAGFDEGIKITWTNDEGDYYIVEGNTTSTDCMYDYDDDDDMPAKSFKLSFTQGTDATLSSTDFNYYGTYSIYVMHISSEYAVFSQGGSTTSTTLVDVQGNIDGAYGIFTGVSKFSKNIKVSKGSMPSPF